MGGVMGGAMGGDSENESKNPPAERQGGSANGRLGPAMAYSFNAARRESDSTCKAGPAVHSRQQVTGRSG